VSLEREHFTEFFETVHSGHSPFRWQQRLLDHLLDTGRWPDQIVAPTGAGKTAVIDVHVFAVALMAIGAARRLPRRLALVVGRRSLVDDQHEHVRRLAALLAGEPAGVLGEVAHALRELRWAGDLADQDGRAASPLIVARLRGGIPASRGWRDDPTACAVVCATPDMWGSRLLMRGYGATPAASPREGGLLAMDAVVVVDEAHLARQLLVTGRRVAELVGVADEPVPVPALQVVETTATPGDARGSAVGVEPEELETDESLARRMRTPKPVRTLPLPEWPVPRKAAGLAAIRCLADEVIVLRERHGPTAGCFVNTVDVAVRLTAELAARGLTVELFCGRMRPYDLRQVNIRWPGLLSLEGNEAVDVIVATQTLEVGVDIDLSAALTELAPSASLAQRSGRVNRIGRRATAEVVVAVPTQPLGDQARSGPYTATDLNSAMLWIKEREADPSGLAPWALREAPPPSPTPRRLLYQRVELADVWHWARTSDDLAAEPDLDLWLADDFEPEHDVGIVVRRMMPTEPADAVALIRALPPRPYEVFPTPLATARNALTMVTLAEGGGPQAVRIRGEETTAVEPVPRLGGEPMVDVRPGDVFVVNDDVPIFIAGTVADHAEGLTTASEVLEALPDASRGEVVLRVEAAVWPTDYADEMAVVLKEAADLLSDARSVKDARARISELIEGVASGCAHPAMLGAATKLLRRAVKDCEVITQSAPDGGVLRLLVIDIRKAIRDEAIRQLWSNKGQLVALSDHAANVAARAAELADRLDLGERVREMLRLAGLHHDDGKDDWRFQRSLGAVDRLLAKSGMTSPSERRAARASSGLPPNWRHEQLSVLRCWPTLTGLSTGDRYLVARLVGTSHGYGRHSFPHSAAELIEEDENSLARELFDEGGWDEIIEHTHRAWGAWGCAYLEAVLRAADGQISGEGS